MRKQTWAEGHVRHDQWVAMVRLAVVVSCFALLGEARYIRRWTDASLIEEPCIIKARWEGEVEERKLGNGRDGSAVRVQVLGVLRGPQLPARLEVVMAGFMYLEHDDRTCLWFGRWDGKKLTLPNGDCVVSATLWDYFGALVSPAPVAALLRLLERPATDAAVRERIYLYLHEGRTPWPWERPHAGTEQAEGWQNWEPKLTPAEEDRLLAAILQRAPLQYPDIMGLAVYAKRASTLRPELPRRIWALPGKEKGFPLLGILHHYWPEETGKLDLGDSAWTRFGDYDPVAAIEFAVDCAPPLSPAELVLLGNMLEDDQQVAGLEPPRPLLVGQYARELIHVGTGKWLPSAAQLGLDLLGPHPAAGSQAWEQESECPVEVSCRFSAGESQNTFLFTLRNRWESPVLLAYPNVFFLPNTTFYLTDLAAAFAPVEIPGGAVRQIRMVWPADKGDSFRESAMELSAEERNQIRVAFPRPPQPGGWLGVALCPALPEGEAAEATREPAKP